MKKIPAVKEKYLVEISILDTRIAKFVTSVKQKNLKISFNILEHSKHFPIFPTQNFYKRTRVLPPTPP